MLCVGHIPILSGNCMNCWDFRMLLLLDFICYLCELLGFETVISVMQAFSLDFNLRSHMKTHAQENYHICPYPECGKRYAHEYKLKNHIASHHEKVGIFQSSSSLMFLQIPSRLR